MEASDDGRQRTGTVWTATTHAITAVIGSGVLALPWSMAQLGWLLGPIALLAFALVTYFTAILLSDCYRYGDPHEGRRNHTYVDAVRAFLGARAMFVCGCVQYLLLWGTLVGYTITTATSMISIQRTNCRHRRGASSRCDTSGNLYVVFSGAAEIILSQLPNLEKITLISLVAAIMSFIYCFIGLGLCITMFISHHEVRGTVLGMASGSVIIPTSIRVWHAFQALGNIAFAYTYAMVLLEIQDTLKSPPTENKTMKKATGYALGVAALFYMSIGCFGYSAFGNGAQGIVLSGFHEPFWVVDIAHVAVIVHLMGAYQVYSQPLFFIHEKLIVMTCLGTSSFICGVYSLRIPFTQTRFIKFALSKIILRTIFVIFTTMVAMMLPFFNAVVGLLGAIAFWPLTIYFPVSMYIMQAKIQRSSASWICLQMLNVLTFSISTAAVVGSVADIVQQLKHAHFSL